MLNQRTMTTHVSLIGEWNRMHPVGLVCVTENVCVCYSMCMC